MVRLRYALLIACVLLCAPRSEAATVAILRPASSAPALDEALYRLQGELLAVGLAVAIADRPPVRDTDSSEARAWLERAAADGGIDAFIDVIGDSAPVAVDVWIRERSPPHLRVTRVALDPRADNAAATLAIRAIEVLRSSFLVIDLAGQERPAPAKVTAPPPVEQAPPQRAPEARFGLAAGATALTSFGGVGPALLPLGRLELALGSHLALEATVAGLGSRPRVESDAGSVTVAQQFGLLGLCWCALSGKGVTPVVALSAGALRTALDGEASAPNLAHHVDQWALLLDGSAGARIALADPFYLTLASHVQVAEPYVAIHFVDAVVATTGSPNLLFTLTAGARL